MLAIWFAKVKKNKSKNHFVICKRGRRSLDWHYLTFVEIEKLRFGKETEYLDVDSPKNITVVKKILVPVQKNPKVTLVGL